MDGLERRYKVRLRKTYEDSVDAKNIQIKDSLVGISVLTGTSAIALSLGLPLIILAGIITYPAYLNVSLLVKSIIIKSTLESKIEDIDAQLEEAEAISNEESVGRKRR